MVAIKDMEMPNYCLWDCPLAREDGGECQLADVRTSGKERPNDCPLVEIEERRTGQWLSAEEYALRIGAEVTEDIKNSLYKFCPFCEQTVFMKRNYCPNCGAEMVGYENE